MKRARQIPIPESRTAALLMGLAIGLGIVAPELFFALAAAIVLVVAVEWTMHATREYFEHVKLIHSHS